MVWIWKGRHLICKAESKRLASYYLRYVLCKRIYWILWLNWLIQYENGSGWLEVPIHVSSFQCVIKKLIDYGPKLINVSTILLTLTRESLEQISQNSVHRML